MPIYVYQCGSCGSEHEILQKLSEAPATICPQCGKPTLAKQLTAAGFQLKGSGWYATDFKGGAKTADSTTATATATDTAKPAKACGGSCACHPA